MPRVYVNPLMIVLCAAAVTACAGASAARIHVEASPGIRSELVEHARSMLGTLYLWGGASPAGFDCSGLVQYSYAKAGIAVPRTAEEQLAATAPLNLDELRPGDLLFFSTAYKQIHVGIYLGDGTFIHAPASGKHVSIATVDDVYWRDAFYRAGSFF